MSDRKCLVACIDGATEGYIHAFASELPRFRRHVYQQCWGPVQAACCLSAPAWVEFGIGKSPERLGVRGNRPFPGYPRGWEAPDFADQWIAFRALAEIEVATGVYHVPIWCEPPEYIGQMLEPHGGWVVRGDWLHDPGSWPEVPFDLRETPLREAIKEGQAQIRVKETGKPVVDAARKLAGLPAGHKRWALGALDRFADESAEEVKRLYEWREVDCLVAYWYGLDFAGHYLSYSMDFMLRAYQAADGWLGALLDLEEWDTVIVTSDHGTRPNQRMLHSLEFDGLHYAWDKTGDEGSNGKAKTVIEVGTHCERGFWSSWERNWLKATEDQLPRPCARYLMRLGSIMPEVARMYGAENPEGLMPWDGKLLDWEYIRSTREQIEEMKVNGKPGKLIEIRNVALDRDKRDGRTYSKDDEARITERLRDLGYVGQ